jgi:ferredoxin
MKKLLIDKDKCQGHNRCAAIISDLVDIDGLGFASVKLDGHFDDSRLIDVNKAIDNCPENAISIFVELSGDDNV